MPETDRALDRLRCWVLTTGEVGMRHQALGLVERLGLDYEEKTVGLRAPWRWLPPHRAPGALMGLDPYQDQVEPPWPDLVVTCGRRSAALSIAIRRAAKGKTRTVHIQNPKTRPDAFDLIIAMSHDGLQGDNVMAIDTALHSITQDALDEARKTWTDRFSALPRPLVGLILGGVTRGGDFTPERVNTLAMTLEEANAASGLGLVVSPSRRTDPSVIQFLQDRCSEWPWAWIWDGKGDNPYLGMLATCDRLVVSGDSVSMVSEALSTGKPVAVARLGSETRRQTQFLDGLRDRGAICDPDAAFFNGAGTPHAAIDATPKAAERVRDLFDS